MEVGDVVKLKSGGPKMTVEAVIPSDEGPEFLACVWFPYWTQEMSEYARMQREHLPAQAVRQVVSQAPPAPPLETPNPATP